MQTNKIKSYMALHGFTIKSLAAELGIATKTMSSKISGKAYFTVNEARKITELLRIENPTDIFFN